MLNKISDSSDSSSSNTKKTVFTSVTYGKRCVVI